MNERAVSDTAFVESLKSLIDAYFQTKMKSMVLTQQVETAPQSKLPLRNALTIDEACEYVGGVSRPSFYSNVLPRVESFRIGRRRFVLRSELDKYIEISSHGYY